MNSSLIKKIIVGAGAISIVLLFLPYLSGHNAIETVMAAAEASSKWGTEYFLEFILPVIFTVSGMFLFLIKSNKGTAVIGILLNLLSWLLYYKSKGYIEDRSLSADYGFMINMVVTIITVVLYGAFIIVRSKEKRKNL